MFFKKTMNFLARKKIVFLGLGFIFLSAFVFNPNPFGNNPDAVADESYFLTSGLSAIKKQTLPGWEFSASGSFYGGVQSYLDTIVLAPVLGVIFFDSGSYAKTAVTVALHTGDIIHVLRLINGLLVILLIAGIFYLSKKNNWPRELNFALALFGITIFGNSLFAGIIHTAKVWSLYSIVEIMLGSAVVIQAFTSERGEPWLERKNFTALILWLFILLCLQNIVGVTAGLWLLYALILKLANFKDIIPFLKKYGLLVIAVLILDASFLYRSFTLFNDSNNLYRLNDIAGSLTTTRDEAFDWGLRLIYPLKLAVQSQPLSIFYIFALLILIAQFLRTRIIPPRLTLVAAAHPILIYILVHAIFGLSAFPRYILPLTIALAFSMMILIKEKTRLAKITFAFGIIFVMAVAYPMIKLYWQASSEKIINKTFAADSNRSDVLILADGSAGRISFPINSGSLALLNSKQKGMERFKFLSANAAFVDAATNFKPLFAAANTERSVTEIVSSTPGAKEIWIISGDCKKRCGTDNNCTEINYASCLAKNAPAHEVTTIPDLLRAERLGSYYMVRRQITDKK